MFRPRKNFRPKLSLLTVGILGLYASQPALAEESSTP